MATTKKSNKSTSDNTKTQSQSQAVENDAVEPDGTPVLDEKDLEENNLTVEEAENIEWDDEEELNEKAAITAEEDDDEEEEDV